MKYLNKEIENIENIIVDLKNIVSDIKDRVNDITYKIDYYEDKLSKMENIKKIEEEITKEKIVKLFEDLFRTSISENALADISINKDKIKIVGRPKLNNSNKQMRHIIPYSFIENMIKSQVIAKEDFRDLLNVFAENMKLFIYDIEGICLSNSEYDYINTLNMISEIVARFILTLFNLKEYMSFPDEGNTLNYEIRLEELNSKKFKIISHSYIEKNIEYLIKNNDIKLRIVNNEGVIVRRTGKGPNHIK